MYDYSLFSFLIVLSVLIIEACVSVLYRYHQVWRVKYIQLLISFVGIFLIKNRFIDFEILRCFILQAVRRTMSLFKQYRAIYVDSDIDLFMQCINSTNYYGCINCNLWLLNNVTTICTPLKYYYITGSKQLPLFHKPLHCRPQFLWV